MDRPKENTLLGRRRGTRAEINVALRSNPQMERVMSFVVDWFSLEEMKAPTRCLCADVCLNQRVAIPRCGEIYRKTGKRTCQKKKKVPPCENATVSSEVPDHTQQVSG